MTDRGRLDADEWARAALEALASGGLAAIAVEPLAKRLGTTKGSFYWHFRNRDALITATLRYWEQRYTETVIATADEITDPEQRLHGLFVQVMEPGATQGVELALLASAEHPLVAPVLRRVGRRRVDYVADLFAQLGFAEADARLKAVIGVSVYHGFHQLARTAPQALPDSPAGRRHLVDVAMAGLLADLPRLPAAHSPSQRARFMSTRGRWPLP